MRRFLTYTLLTLTILITLTAIDVWAQGPSSAQIQQALQVFVQQAHTWTQRQTFSDITVNGSCTGCGGGGGGDITPTTITLPETTSSAAGVIFQPSGHTLLHTYADATATLNTNIFLGYDTGNFTLSPSGGGIFLGSYNTLMGYQVGQHLTTGWKNVGVGVHALQAITTGNHNVGIGSNALGACTDCVNNTAVGEDTLTLSTSTSGNTALGYQAMHDATTTLESVGVGANAGLSVTGSYYVAIGFNAGRGFGSANFNTAVGSGAVHSNGSPAEITGLGYDTLATATGGGNTAVGAWAGSGFQEGSPITTGTNSTYVGTRATGSSGTITNSIAIGYGTQATADNLTIIGNSSTTVFKAFGDYFLNAAALLFSRTAPTIASGGCTSPAVTHSNGTASFLITIGTSCTGVKTITLTLAAAAHFWACDANNNTSSAQQDANIIGSRATSTTAVVLTNYARTTGLQADFTASDTLLVKCSGE